MMLVAIKALVGTNYVRPEHVIAVTATEQFKCVVVLTGGVTVPCYEAASDVIVKLGATTTGT